MRTSNSAKAGISIQIRQCVANHFVGGLITELTSIPLSVFNPFAAAFFFSTLLPSFGSSSASLPLFGGPKRGRELRGREAAERQRGSCGGI